MHQKEEEIKKGKRKMEEFKIYKSIDGKIFNSRSECARWEELVLCNPLSITFYDEQMNELYGHGIGAVKMAYNLAAFMEIVDTPALDEEIFFLKSYYDIDISDLEPGFYVYDPAKAEWIQEEKY